MTTLRSPLELEMLLQSSYRADMLEADIPVTEPHREALHLLVKHGLCELHDNTLKATEKGRFFINHLLAQPFPEVTYRIPSQ